MASKSKALAELLESDGDVVSTALDNANVAVKVYSVKPTTVTATGSTITIIGEGFVSGATVHFVSAADGAQTAAASVTYVSATKLTITNPQLKAAAEPWSVKVTNPNGQSAAIESAIDAGGVPAWSTAAGKVGDDTVQAQSFSSTVAASDPEGTAISYSESGTDVLTGSGSGKLNFTLNASSGAITGTMPSLGSDTTFNFTLAAAAGGDITTRNFNIVGKVGTKTVNHLYGGVISCVKSTHGSYGLDGAMQAFVKTSAGDENYDAAQNTVETANYLGTHDGAHNQNASNEIFTAQGNTDGRFYSNCNGSQQTGSAINVGYWTGRLYVPADHNKIRVEWYAHSYNSNQQTSAGDMFFGLRTGTFSSSAHSGGGSAVANSGGFSGLGYATSYGGKATGTRQLDGDINATTINGSAHYFAFFAQGGQHSETNLSLYRLATYNSTVGLEP